VFLVEGRKMVEEALGSGFEIDLLACTEEFAFNHPQLPDKTKELVVADAESIRKASLQKIRKTFWLSSGNQKPGQPYSGIGTGACA
jgi:hypothetical protein